MKKILLYILPHKLQIIIRSIQIFCQKKFKMITHNCYGFLILTPQHSNLGDHALALSELTILKKQNLYVIEITGKELNIILKYPFLLKRLIKNKPIFFNGGGYIGTLWYEAEVMLRKIVKLFSKNKIIIFPQTVYFEDSEYGKNELKNSVNLYGLKNDMTMMAREKTSFEMLKSSFKNEIILMPDMVLFLKPVVLNCARNGVLTIFRNDIEKTMQENEKEQIVEYLFEKYEKVIMSDMNYKNEILLPRDREKALNEKFKQFFSSELVVTDRLHGMIFSVITGTPCIVLNSKSPKVKGVYDWLLKDCPYVLFMDVFDKQKAEKFIASVRGKTFEYDNSFIKPYYEELLNIINGENNIERNKKCKIK